MINKFKSLLFMYSIPFISAVIFATTKDVQINGEEVEFLARAIIGFIAGVCFEGLFIMIAMTFAVLSGKFE